jgi:hypothetical protein
MSKKFGPSYLYFLLFGGGLAYVAVGAIYSVATVEGGQLSSQIFLFAIAIAASIILWIVGQNFTLYRNGLILDEVGISCDAFLEKFGAKTIPWSKIGDASIVSDGVPRHILFLRFRLKKQESTDKIWQPKIMEFHIPLLWLSLNSEEFYTEFGRRMNTESSKASIEE